MTIRNKILLLFTTFTICVNISKAQVFGNEWIDFNQEYFKISVVEDGMYRLNFDQLDGVGFPVNTIDPRRIQLFYKGQEQAIYIEGQQDGNFDTNDYIEFYGKRNDGTSDANLYIDPSAQPHQFYNLFSDSTAYFLTYQLGAVNGKRMTSFFENNVTSIPAESSFEKEFLDLFIENYVEGESYGATNEILLSQYDDSEGWTGEYASLGQNIDHIIEDIVVTFQGSDLPFLEILLTGGNNNAHSAEIFVGPAHTSLRSLGTVEFNKDEHIIFSSNILYNDIRADGDLAIRVTVNGVDGQADRMAMSYARFTYQKRFVFIDEDRQVMTLQANPSGKSFIEINTELTNSGLWDITDTENIVQIQYNSSFEEITAIIPNTEIERTLYLQEAIIAPPTIKQISFQQIDPTAFNYLIITNELLQQATSTSLPNPVNTYKNYRESAQGGNYDVLVLNTDQVFDQFNFGLTSPLAIRRFCQFMIDGGNPEFLFLIGRGTDNDFDYYRQDPATAEATNFVPTYGHPGSDIAFSSGLLSSGLEEGIPTGRINAKSPDDVQAYLDKVIETESLVYNELWHKNILHLTGGQNESELVRFRQFGEGFEEIAVGPLLGANVSKTSKKTDDVVEFFNITGEINAGVGLITFFGHSGASITDIEVGIVSDPSFGYDNRGRYPTFIVNGCNAGAFFGTTESFGVDWVLTPNLGALSFMAHSSLAFSSNLRNYTNLFYEVAFTEDDFFAQPLGTIKKEVSRRYSDVFGTGESSSSQVQQFILQGDPAIKIFAADKPDFDIIESTVVTSTADGSPLLSIVDSFVIDFEVVNYGKYSDEPFFVTVNRTLPNGNEIKYGPELYDPLLRQDTLSFVIDNQLEGVGGNNSFEIILDDDGIIDEMDENNNSASFDLFLASGSTFNILPQNFSIQNESTLDFYFQATNPLSGTREFLLEVDRDPNFNSSFLMQLTETANVVGQVSVDLESNGALTDGTEIYWRTKFANPQPSEANEWVNSSFVVESSGEGWQQSSPNQLNQSSFSGLEFNEVSGIWSFISNDLDFEINTFGPNHPTFNHEDTRFILDGINFFNTNSPLDPGCRDNTLNIVAFDFQSTIPYRPLELGGADVLNNRICGRIPQVIYNLTEAEAATIALSVIDNIPDRDKVLVFSLGELQYSTWPIELKDKLVELGISFTTLNNLEDGEPIIFLGTKGEPEGSAVEVLANLTPKSEQEIELISSIPGKFFSGQLISDKIGPAKSYGNFDFVIDQTGANIDESFDFTIFGIDENEQEIPLLENIQTANTDLSTIDAGLYPFLRLQLNLEDETDLTPFQLNEWNITYEEAPEGILLKRESQGIDSPIQKQEGETLSAAFTYWNVSEKDYTDSIEVVFDIFNRESNTFIKDSLKLKALTANDSVNFDIVIETLGKSGSNDLILTANESAQLETHENNNSIRLTEFLQIVPDQTNPILEVTFDGAFILDGDIVSPNPNVLVTLRDDNQFRFKEDTLGLDLFLKSPCEDCEFERIPFTSPELSWTPAGADQNLEITYSPTNLENGIYGLRVQAVDASGNESGMEPYEINFEVINESTITNFYPYPNPFSSNTRFVFTLTGNEIPDDIKIQIMTVSGRIVREILRDELGVIRIGNNITDYAWDGRDEFGDQLANGVYIYKVFVQQNGQAIDLRESAGDRGFKNGFGKIYLLR